MKAHTKQNQLYIFLIQKPAFIGFLRILDVHTKSCIEIWVLVQLERVKRYQRLEIHPTFCGLWAKSTKKSED